MKNNLVKEKMNKFIMNSKIGLEYEIKKNEIVIIFNHYKIKYLFEFCDTTTKAAISIILNKDNISDRIIISNYINPSLSEKLKENGINFLDAQGNCFIKSGGIFIFVKCEKQKTAGKSLPIPRNYNTTDIKMIFSVLVNDNLINTNQRNISQISKIPLGSVSMILRKLEAQKYLIRSSAKNRIINKKELFERWCVAYSDMFKPKIFLGKFRGNISLTENIDGLWGGEPAAFLLNNLIKPETLTIYLTKAKLNKFLLEKKLLKDPEGNIEIYDSSWLNEGPDIGHNTVHTFIIYADLLSAGNQRTNETAKTIYREYIETKLR
jgi:hypothetical protein